MYFKSSLKNSQNNIFNIVLFLITVSVISLAKSVSAGVLVSPTVVFMYDNQPTGRLTIQNPSDLPKEITIKFSFGLPESDDEGNVFVNLNDSTVTDPRSALKWLKAFPRKFILPPNGQQIVRIVARPPAGLSDGEYWARVIVRSEEGTINAPSSSDQVGISTKVNMIMQTAIMLKYRTGDLMTSIELRDSQLEVEDSKVILKADLYNLGNTSYMGMINCRLLDANNKQISYKIIDLAVYRNLKRRIELPIIEGEFKKPWRVELFISSEGRTDVAPEDMIAGNKIERTFQLP